MSSPALLPLKLIDHRRRRALLGAALAAMAAPSVWAGPDAPGWVRPPLALPQLPLSLDDGRATDLHALTQGSLTALQFVWTGCSASCSLLGEIFRQLQRQLTANGVSGVRLLS